MHPGMEGIDSECEMSGAEEEARSPSACSLSSNKGSNSNDEKTTIPTVSNTDTCIYDNLSPKQELLDSAPVVRDDGAKVTHSQNERGRLICLAVQILLDKIFPQLVFLEQLTQLLS